MRKETVIDRAPMVRCYKCGSPEVFSLCHHCARPMCEKHSPFAFRQAGTPARGVGDGVRDSVKPASLEFAWLKQSDPRRAAVYHCAEHDHTVRNALVSLTGFGIALAVLGVIVLLFVIVPGVLLLLAGVVLAALGFVQRGRQSASDPASLPPLPLFPHVNTVEVIERLNGKISFAGGRYTSTADGSVAGEITIDMSANDGEDWLQRYRRKHRLPGHEPVKFAAGFVTIRGKAGLRFAAGQDVVLANGTGLSLSGNSAVSHHLFEHVPGRPPGEWILSARYEVVADSTPDGIPLWIVPSVVPSSDRRTLEIDLHWNQLGPKGRKLNLTRFESIVLEVPAGWGAVQGSDPGGPTIESGYRGHRIIRWEQIGPASDRGGQQPSAVRYGGKSRTLTLRFERPVLPAPDEDEPEPEANGNGTRQSATTEEPRFRGTLKATFEGTHSDVGTLSGVEGIDIYLPGGGGTRQKPEVRVRTEVTVEFDISLGAIRYQDDWVVPDDSNAKVQQDDSGQTRRLGLRSKADEVTGVVPDSRTVTELTNLISGEGYYVKSAVEHPPYRDDRRGNVVNHVWDIAGRWYHGVFPVDFDINLRGEEVVEDGYGGFSGKTVVQVTVKGTYVNDEGLTQRKLIEAKWDNLYGHVTGLLRSRAAGGSGARAIASPGAASERDDIARGVTVQDSGVREDHRTRESVVVDAEIIETEPLVTAPYDRAGAEHKADLMKQWRAADDAVMAGRISEDTYRGIIARINTELRELGEQP